MLGETQQAAGAAGIIGPLGIDGKIFIAQLVNISVVVFVLWKWVYKPLLKVLDDRTKKIEQGLRDAAESAAARQRSEQEKDQVVLEARLKAKGIVEEARTTAQAEGEALVRKARQEVERVVAQGREQLRLDKEKLADEVKADIGGLLAQAVETIARQKLDPAKDAELIRASLKDAAGKL